MLYMSFVVANGPGSNDCREIISLCSDHCAPGPAEGTEGGSQ